MSIFTMFGKKPSPTTSYRIADQDKAIRVLSQNYDTTDTAVLTEIMTGSFQSVNSLSTGLRLNKERVQRSLSRLYRAGLIKPVQER